MSKNLQYERPHVALLRSRLNEKRRFIQVLAGPRQTGKTTIAQQVVETLSIPCHQASADEPALKTSFWIEQHWETARALASKEANESLLVIDEAQKIPGWSETVKRLWDEDTAKRRQVKVVLLGSSPLLMQRGLTESLAGRFEVVAVTHWSFAEMKNAFAWSPDQYIFFGGYPGSAELIGDEPRWRRYILDSLIETTVSRDILLMTRVDKPALLRQVFHLACVHSGQILSYQKMLGQLHDAGNTTTLAHYLDLLRTAGMITGLQKYSGKAVRQRQSSPKLLVMNTALMSAQSETTFEETKKRPEIWGRFVESAVGAHLVNECTGTTMNVFFWRESGHEVDYIVQEGRKIIAIEVKSGKPRENLSGIDVFSQHHHPQRKLLVGSGGIPIEDFLSTPLTRWFEI
ncbi:MAG: ATP-binding protein [Ignavibacteriae bacterium]|nr:ATP-binding protein [Ignavibacteriota bacterium]